MSYYHFIEPREVYSRVHLTVKHAITMHTCGKGSATPGGPARQAVSVTVRGYRLPLLYLAGGA